MTVATPIPKNTNQKRRSRGGASMLFGSIGLGIATEALGAFSFGAFMSIESLSASGGSPPSRLFFTTSEMLDEDMARLCPFPTFVVDEKWLIGELSTDAVRSVTVCTDAGWLAIGGCTKRVVEVASSSISCASSKLSLGGRAEDEGLVGLTTVVGVKDTLFAGVSSAVSYPSTVGVGATTGLREA